MKKILLLITLLSSHFLSIHAQTNGNWKMDNFKSPEQIQLIDAFEQVRDMTHVDHIFSKARGYTIFSSITNVNNRSLQKLKAEASMKGGTHILIHTIANESAFGSKVVSYHASIYRDYSLNNNELRSMLEGNRYYFTFMRTYDRNEFGSTFKMVPDPQSRLQGFDKVVEEDGKIFILKSNKTGSNSPEKYEVIDFDDDYLLLLTTETKNRKYILDGLQKRND